MLRDGRVDAALLHSPFDRRGIDFEPLRSEPIVAALSAAHPLSRRRRLRRADLDREPFPRWSGTDEQAAAYWEGRDSESRRTAWPEGTEHDHGSERPPVGDLAQLLATVALGQAVALLPASTAAAQPLVEAAPGRPGAPLSR